MNFDVGNRMKPKLLNFLLAMCIHLFNCCACHAAYVNLDWPSKANERSSFDKLSLVTMWPHNSRVSFLELIKWSGKDGLVLTRLGWSKTRERYAQQNSILPQYLLSCHAYVFASVNCEICLHVVKKYPIVWMRENTRVREITRRCWWLLFCIRENK
jgi:hypothetical protein